uniref:Uncharacterized protein n=1 Tax=Anguilla anguilla TaxID=7936 RepID=A0A0E9VQH4_ANGAN
MYVMAKRTTMFILPIILCKQWTFI